MWQLHHVPPVAGEAVHSWIRSHKWGLQLAILLALMLAIDFAIDAAWAASRGASHIRDWIAGNTAVSIPVEWEQPLGEEALAQMRRQGRFITDPQVLEPLRQLAAKLVTDQPSPAGQFKLFVADSAEINAVALPGGFIIVSRGLLEHANAPGEIQGVVAHEIAHIIKRHGIVQLTQDVGIELILQRLKGNEGAFLEALVRDSGKLVGSKFSRHHEREADDLAWKLLQTAQINPQGMVDFFAGMKMEMDAKGPDGFPLGASLLGMHPMPQERMDRLGLKRAVVNVHEYQSYETEFKALQRQLRLRAQSGEDLPRLTPIKI